MQKQSEQFSLDNKHLGFFLEFRNRQSSNNSSHTLFQPPENTGSSATVMNEPFLTAHPVGQAGIHQASKY